MADSNYFYTGIDTMLEFLCMHNAVCLHFYMHSYDSVHSLSGLGNVALLTYLKKKN